MRKEWPTGQASQQPGMPGQPGQWESGQCLAAIFWSPARLIRKKNILVYLEIISVRVFWLNLFGMQLSNTEKASTYEIIIVKED